jgi:mRNA-degrading endonuclease RelE of RelBE toxin-antitoxin system
MPYTIVIRDVAYDELQAIKPFYRMRIIDAIDEQLAHQPNVETKNRKLLAGFQPDFEHDDPVWELRVGQHRVYYDMNEELKTVVIRAVREKPPHITTEQVT